MIKSFDCALKDNRVTEELLSVLERKKDSVALTGAVGSVKAHVIARAAESFSVCVVISEDEASSEALKEDLSFFRDQILEFPAKDLMFYQADLKGNILSAERMRCLRRLLAPKEEDRGKPVLLVTTIDALQNPLPSMERLLGSRLVLKVGEEYKTEELHRRLQELGYRREDRVEESGTFVQRGGILDIFPLTEELPCRIEFWGDEIDTIRIFDPISQRSLDLQEDEDPLEEMEIFPAGEVIFSPGEREKVREKVRREAASQTEYFRKEGKEKEVFNTEETLQRALEALEEGESPERLDPLLPYLPEKIHTLMDTLKGRDCLLVFNEPRHLKERGEALEAEYREAMEGRLSHGYILPTESRILVSMKEVIASVQGFQSFSVSQLDERKGLVETTEFYRLSAQSVNSYKDRTDLMIQDLKRYKREKYRTVLLCGGPSRAKRMAEELRQYELSAFYDETGDIDVPPSSILVMPGTLRKGFCYPLSRHLYLTETDLFGGKKKKKRKKYKDGEALHSLQDLKNGDYVIHENHGVGIYQGIERMKDPEGNLRDYITIQYAGNSKLCIPASQFRMIQKFRDKDGPPPRLHTLGGKEWKKTKSRVKKAVEALAEELVLLYAERREAKAHAYGEDTPWQKEFEESFPYEETEDQKKAIEDVKRDMESTRIMDRLLCGDVGFGKTEVAIRAAFKAVQENKQVVYLVPTTILAQQHYNTFTERMKDYPIRIDFLSRFVSRKDTEKIRESVKRGSTDILIGTHRILSKDIEYKNLGLLIIDEEQRFGVKHKEALKMLKTNVDVLSMTATPIPRTLHMSLIGVRDLSLLEEAPKDRKPIQTYVMEENPEIVKEAIQRELKRGGQVYYVYNRIRDMEDFTARLRALLPDASIACVHGRMPEDSLEEIMVDFVNGDIDVLVSTSIIETGLDIPNVNTILIHNADRFGLSQLYQLRGRVGRSGRNAYAFIFYQRDKALKEVQEKRLAAIREYTELGSGVKIAMRDLEIRGAGNLLGESQSGHMELVGYDMYVKLLSEALKKQRGEKVEEEFDTTVELPLNAYLPDSYISNEFEKLDMYKRIADLDTEEEKEELTDELVDRYGEPPRPVLTLLEVSRIRSLAHEASLTAVRGTLDRMILPFCLSTELNMPKLTMLLRDYGGSLKIMAGKEPYLVFEPLSSGGKNRKIAQKDVQKLLDSLKSLLIRIKELILQAKGNIINPLSSFFRRNL